MSWPQILDPADGVCHEGVKKKLHRVCDLFYKLNAARLIWDFIQSCTAVTVTDNGAP
jgi:hypothetical protein